MRVARTSLGSLNDFVPGLYTVPQNPVVTNGLSEFSRGAFSVPHNPVGMSGCGCGCDGDCGGMGAIDWSLTSTSLGSEIGIPTVPNWLLYMGVIGVAALVYSGSGGSGRRRR